jgi:MFS family permease
VATPEKTDDREDDQASLAEEAELEGDVLIRPGTVRSALAHRTFRRFWIGAFSSNIGSWMQNVALGVFAYDISHSSVYVAALGFAQLGPSFVLAMVGGALADMVDRRAMVIACQTEQMIMSLVLAWAAAASHPSRVFVFLCVLAVGVGQALNGPVFSAVLPMLVGRRDMPGAISLQSVQMNLSRVLGPALGGLLFPLVHAWGIFVVNAATYIFVIVAVLTVRLPKPDKGRGESVWRRLSGGLAVARNDRLIRACILTIFAISFFCLPFIGLMPVLAATDLHLNPTSALYGALYAAFGLGAALGAVSVGTIFVERDRPRLVRVGLVLFAGALAGFGLVRNPAGGFGLAPIVGYTYFLTVTSLSTTLQENLDDRVRGRVMALWIMAFGGTVPLGLMASGPLVAITSVTAVLSIGAGVALVLAVAVRLRPGQVI